MKTDIKERAFRHALMVIGFMEKLPKDITCNIITGQLLRSATSIGANLVEARAASSRKDFTNFYNHALKSANESLYWLELLEHSGKTLLVTESILKIKQENKEISNILAACIISLKKSRYI